MQSDDTLVSFGGALKALDGSGKVGGYLVLFGGPDATDASRFRDYFTRDTDFGLDLSTKTRVLYHHGLDPHLGRRSLGVANLKADDVGVWMEGQLALRDDYERKIWGMVRDKKLGLSSGTVGHLIGREAQPNGSQKIVSWPLGLDASITPTPAEPRTSCVALKSLIPPAAKGLHLGEYAEVSAVMAALRALQERAANATFQAMGDEKATAADRLARIAGALDESRDLALAMIRPLLAGMDPKDDGAAKRLADEDLRLFDQFMEIEARLNGALA